MTIDPATLAITAALNAASMALTMSKTTEGPRLSDLTATVADYGTPLNYFYGTRRLEVPCFFAEPIKELKKKRKTKGGKYNEYTYYGTWAVAVADHEIGSVRRVWFDRNLVYDVNSGKDLFSISDGYELSSFMRFYLGTEDQEADERMVATVEADEGAGTCPAYLGVAYIFFEDVPLERLGNRFPQVSVEATSADAIEQPIDYSYDVVDLDAYFSQDYGVEPGSFNVSPNGTKMCCINRLNGVLFVFDNTTQTLLAAHDGTLDDFGGWGPTETLAVNDDGDVYLHATQDGDLFELDRLYKITLDGTLTSLASLDAWNDVSFTYIFEVPSKGEYVFTAKKDADQGYDYLYAINGAGGVGTLGFRVTGWFQDTYGNIWAAGQDDLQTANPAGITKFYLQRVVSSGLGGSGPTSFTVTGVVGGVSPQAQGTYVKQGVAESFLILFGARLYSVDRITGVATEAFNFGYGPFPSIFANRIPGSSTLWIGYAGGNATEYLVPSMTAVRTVNLSDWVSESLLGDSDAVIFDHYNNALLSTGTITNYNSVVWRYLEQPVAGVTLRTICEDVSDRVGIDSDDYDFTDLDQTIIGYSWTQGAARQILAPLLEIYDSDIRPSGFTIEGLKRSTPTNGGTIESAWMARDRGPLYEIKTKADSDLPRRIFGIFADIDADQQPNSAVAQRNSNAIDTESEYTLDLSTLALDVDDAQPLVERMLRRRWMGAVEVQCAVTLKELDLDPSDVRTLDLDGEQIECSLRRMTIKPDKSITTYWERDDATVAATITSEGAGAAGRPPTEVYFPVATRGFVLDIPLITDAHDQSVPFLYIAAGAAEEGSWPGADVWASDSGGDDSYSSGWDGIGSGEASTVGVVQGILPDALTTVVDEGTQLVVALTDGTLESITQDAFDNNADLNLALVGSEIIQFRDAVLQSDGEYILSGLRRGVRGTEQHVATHSSGEAFLLLSSSTKRHDIGAGEIGDTDYYKVATMGFGIADVEPIVVPFAAVAQKPYSPAHVTLVNETNGDWTITWSRRTRVGGASLDGRDVPLGETSEAYKVRILEGISGAVVRTIEVTSETATYLAADQVSDWGSEQTTLTVEVLQVSPSLGIDGFETLATA